MYRKLKKWEKLIIENGGAHIAITLDEVEGSVILREEEFTLKNVEKEVRKIMKLLK